MQRRKRKLVPKSGSPTRHLVMLSLLLVFVLFVMSRLHEPGMWTWLTGLDGARPAGESSVPTTRASDFGDEPETGLIVAARSNGDSTPTETSSAAAMQNASEAPRSDLGVDMSLFAGIQDKTRVVPRQAYFHLLDVARRTSSADFDRTATRGLTFAHFASRPELLRGTPVHLTGRLQRLTEITAPANREGFERLYEGWLFTGESQGNPYVIVLSELPEHMPLGGDVREHVSFSGFFLKLWSYTSGDGVRYAPLLIGHSVTWHRPPPARSVRGGAYVASLALVVVLISLLYFVIWWSQRSAARLRQKYARATPEVDPTTVQALGERTTSTEDYLAQIEREAETDSGDTSRESETP